MNSCVLQAVPSVEGGTPQAVNRLPGLDEDCGSEVYGCCLPDLPSEGPVALDPAVLCRYLDMFLYMVLNPGKVHCWRCDHYFLCKTVSKRFHLEGPRQQRDSGSRL